MLDGFPFVALFLVDPYKLLFIGRNIFSYDLWIHGSKQSGIKKHGYHFQVRFIIQGVQILVVLA